MNKTVKTLLAEFHLLLLNNKLTQLHESEGSGVKTDNVIQKIKDVKQNLKLPKNRIKKYLDLEVKNIPKLIKDGNKIVGIAIQIGKLGSMPNYLTYIEYNGKKTFNVTASPTEFVTEIGNYPKEVKKLNFQLGIDPHLTHIVYPENYKLFLLRVIVLDEFVHINGYIYTYDNHLIATTFEDNSLKFEEDTKGMDKRVIEDMWKRGLISKKEEYV